MALCTADMALGMQVSEVDAMRCHESNPSEFETESQSVANCAMVEIKFEADQGEGQRSSGANNLYFEDFDMIYGIDLANLNVSVQLLQTSFLKEWSQHQYQSDRSKIWIDIQIVASCCEQHIELIHPEVGFESVNIGLAYAAIIEVGYEKIQKEKNQMELSLEAGIKNIFILKRMNWFKPLDCDNSYILLAKLGFTNQSRRIKRHRAEVGIPGVGAKIEIESISFKSRSGID
ncbi:hypothetical protein LXL04_039089 [Taraxacum kok-saghyz]